MGVNGDGEAGFEFGRTQETCKSWCPSVTHEWKEKCKWGHCIHCTECAALTAKPASAFTVAAFESSTCPPGSEPITSQAECQDAAADYDIKEPVRTKNGSGRPKGCYLYGKRFLFNGAEHGKANNRCAMVCKSK